MSICDDCEFRHYSPELCRMHLKHLASANSKSKLPKAIKKMFSIKASLTNKDTNKNKCNELFEPEQEIQIIENEKVVKSLLYGGTCALGTTLVVAAAPVLGLPAIAHALGITVSAGIAGGTIPFFKSKKKH
ncbi:MAG: hypothetical protein HQK49_06470 [Oligoflexia bacterium]|nr:hypothetical protein [Oligoflexia bacterium]